ncbi:MAG TPA: hypothetical protein VF526_08385 [Solirubrobacteraceae bacterium]
MPDQDYAGLGLLLCTVLLVVMIVPAPARSPRHEAGMHLILLGTGAGLAILAGVLALAHLPVHSAASGTLAWFTVMPCVWMARAPLPAEGYGPEGEDEDDDGGEPWPRWPGTPRSPENLRPQSAPSGLAGAVAWARPAALASPAAHLPQHAVARHQSPPCASAAPVGIPAIPANALPACGAEEPAVGATPPRRLKPRPRDARADHRSIAHLRAAQPCTGRRRRTSLRRRVLTRCRTWLWPAPPECVTFLVPDHEHEPLRRRPEAERHHASHGAPLR